MNCIYVNSSLRCAALCERGPSPFGFITATASPDLGGAFDEEYAGKTVGKGLAEHFFLKNFDQEALLVVGSGALGFGDEVGGGLGDVASLAGGSEGVVDREIPARG